VDGPKQLKNYRCTGRSIHGYTMIAWRENSDVHTSVNDE
jgi:hypothetical protein